MLESNSASQDKLPKAFFSRIKIRAILRIVLIFVLYLLAFTVLDISSRALEVYPGVVAWYPPDGLSFAFLLTFGAPFFPAFVIASLISSFVVFQIPAPFSALLIWAIFIALAFGLAAWGLRQRIRLDTLLSRMRDLFWLIAVTAAVSTILAVASISASIDAGNIPQTERLGATFQWWVGEMIGILVLTPALLIHVMPHVKRFAEGGALFPKTPISFKRPSALVIMQALSIIVAIYLAAEVSWPNEFHPFFLIAIPLIWIAIEHGLEGVSFSNVLANFGITWAVQRHHDFNPAEIDELQLIMLVISIASLLIGIVVSENKRSEHSGNIEMGRQRKKILYEIILLSILTMAIWIVEYFFDFMEAIVEWEARTQIKGLEETIVSLAFASMAFGVFSYRRWKEAQTESREREKTQGELHSLYRELEAQVQERTADLSNANASLQTEITERKQATAALKNVEAKYRTLVEQLPAISYTIEFRENIQPTYISPQVESILGFSAEEWLEDAGLWRDQLHPEDRDRVLAEYDLKVKLGQSIDMDYRILTRDGRVCWIHDESVLVIDDTGHPHSANGLMFDITERKQIEEALKQSERRFRGLIEHSMEEVSLVDTDGNLIFESPTMRQPLGYPPGSFVGRNLFELFHPDDQPAAIKLLKQVSEQPGSFREAVFRLKHLNGSWIRMEGTVINLLADPAIGAIVINYRDVTQRIEAQHALRDSEERFRMLFAASPDALLLIDPNDPDVIWHILDCNDAACSMNGYSREEMIGQSVDFLNSEPVTREQFTITLEELRREKVTHREALHRHKDGHIFPIEYSSSLFNYGGRELVLGIDRDITQRKRAEAQIQSSAEELSTLYELSRALADTNDLNKMLDLVNHRTVESAHATFARIALLEGDDFVIWSAYPIRFLDHDLLVGNRLPIASMPYCQRVLEQDEPVLLSTNNAEVSDAERDALLLDFAQTVALVPLRVHEFASNSSRILGLLMIGETRKEEREPFTAEKMRLARSIGDQAAIAIDKVRLFNDLQRSNIDLSRAYDATIEGWSAALDLRDKETEGHTLRVTEMTLRLAKEMGLSDQELIQVRRGTLLHDIGKMGVPDRILLKPDKLTDEEWVVMRMHPTYAHQMLKPIAYLEGALDVPYCHHEKWDGTGYPRAMKGEEIPFSARIFAVVDVYDALTSDRPYRPGWPREKTLEHIRQLSGSHFDPKVVDVFLGMIAEENKVV